MLFRRDDGITGIDLQFDRFPEERFDLVLDGGKTRIELRPPTEWESGKGVWMGPRDFMLVTQIERNASRHESIFVELRRNSRKLEELDPAFQEFASQVGNQLAELSGRAINILRWRFGVESPALNSKLPKVLWYDGESWRDLPQRPAHIGWTEGGMRPDEETLDDVLSLLDSDAKQPVGHELLTEAWYLMTRHQRRASLVMGVAAAEVGFKGLVSTLVPGASWLVSNIPTPPLERMIKEYLPTLPVKETIQGKVFVPRIVLDPLKRAVVVRNSIRSRWEA
jgi:hypothetical protein